MKPMDFEEFLWANGISEEITNKLYDYVQTKNTIMSFLHNNLLDLFDKYICIGGMPEVVNAYV